MKKITLIIVSLILSLGVTFGGTGWFQDYILISKNGQSAGYYWIGSNPSFGTELNNYSFGTVSSLFITGCDMKYWADGTDNPRSGGAFYYLVKQESTVIKGPIEVIWNQAYISGNDYQGTTSTNIDLVTGLNPNTSYSLHIYAKSWGTGADSWLSNGGNNYVASFTTPQSSSTDYFRSKSTGIWNSSSNWETSVNGTHSWVVANSIPDNNSAGVTVLNTNTITTSTNTNIQALTINSGGTLIVDTDKQLTAGTLTNNGTLTLKSGATALTTTISGSGITNVEQSLTSGRQWWYLSSPLSGAYTGTVFSGSQVGIYDEDAFNYTAPFASSTLMSPGLGHVVKFPNTDARTITFTGGLLNNGDITIAPTRTGTANAKRGFNLIGNPYPSYIDWDLLYDPASATNMRNAIWFRTWNGTAMDFHTYSDGDGVPDQASGKIAPMQGFWVKVHADGSNGSLTFKNAHRSHKAETGYNPLKVKAADDRQRVRLVLSDGTNTDETLIVGKSYASDSQDAYDIEKMSNESADVSEIYSMIGTETMVINSVAPITAGRTVALGIRPTSEKAYSITASQLQNIPTDVRVILVDAEAETETELSEGLSYNFVSSAGAVNNRFSIQFRSPGATTLVDNDSKNKILVYSNSQQQIEIISTESLPAGTQIRVFNAAGQTIAQMQATGNRISIPASISKGVYFCHIENTNQNLQYKVIVR